MKKIFTLTISVAALVTISFTSVGQSLTLLTNAQCNAVNFTGAVSQDFQLATTMAETGFIGSDWSLQTSGSANFLAVNNGGNTVANTSYILTTPTYTTSSTTLNIKFDLTGNASITTFSAAVETLTDSIPLGSIANPPNGNYCLSVGLNFVTTTNFRLVFSFTTATGTNGSGTLRFDNWFITSVTAATSVLPVRFQSLDARTVNNAVNLKWNVGSEDGLNGYEIEKSVDGRNYSKIGFVDATGQNSYSFIDIKPSTVSYYRIKSVDVNGRYTYSTVALVKAGKSMIVLKAFPSPFTRNFSIQHATGTGRSLITIASEDGRTIKSIVPATGTQQTEVDLSTAKPGMYLVRFSDGSGTSETLKILKQ